MNPIASSLKRVYWESTASCNLRCIHCRRLDVLDHPSPDELSTQQAKNLLMDIRRMGRPVFIFSGGEPLVRRDFFELAAYARELGLPIALATNGTLIDDAMAERIHDVGIYYASISLDGTTAATHDAFRGAGNFEKSLAGMAALQRHGVKVQINFTVTKHNVNEVPRMYELAQEKKAIALYLFLLVPVGCGVQIADSHMLTAQEVETWLHWVCEKEHERKIPIKAICAPQYFRVEEQSIAPTSVHHEEPERKGCLAGIHMCFISHKGEVFPCGYLPAEAGNVQDLSLHDIWEESKVFAQLRDPGLLTGRCGACEFKGVCGGCRARGFYAKGDILAEEPYCVYTPPRLDPARAAG